MIFGYEGHDAAGHPKKGTIEAQTEEKAAEELRRGGVFAMRLERGGELSKTVLNHPTPTDDVPIDEGEANLSGPSVEEVLGLAQRGDETIQTVPVAPQGTRTLPSQKRSLPTMRPGDRLSSRLEAWATLVMEARGCGLAEEDLRLAARGLLQEIFSLELTERELEKSIGADEDELYASESKAKATKRKKKSGTRK